MRNPRVYGDPPYTVAVIHGGPGAPGSMAPVARELASDWGVLEPLQTAASLEGQVNELRNLLLAHARLPVAVIGSSWGAMLSLILAARHPEIVRTLILVGSGVYEERYAPEIDETRRTRLSEPQRQEVEALLSRMEENAPAQRDAALARLGRIVTRADAYDPFSDDDETVAVQAAVQSVVVERIC